MDFDPVLSWINELSGNWVFIGGLFLAFFTFAMFIRALSDFGVCLLFPALYFLVRKLFLFVPLAGGVSDSNHVAFYNPGYYLVYLGMVIVCPVCLFLVARRINRRSYNRSDGIFGAVFFAIILFILILIVLSLILGDFLKALVLLLFFVVSSAKIMYISPLLLPVIWCSLFINLNTYYRHWSASYSVLKHDEYLFFSYEEYLKDLKKNNKRFMYIIVFAAIANFIFQFSNALTLPAAAGRAGSLFPQDMNLFSSPSPIYDYLGAWSNSLRQIQNQGLNYFSGASLPSSPPGNVFATIPDLWNAILIPFNVILVQWPWLKIVFLGLAAALTLALLAGGDFAFHYRLQRDDFSNLTVAEKEAVLANAPSKLCFLAVIYSWENDSAIREKAYAKMEDGYTRRMARKMLASPYHENHARILGRKGLFNRADFAKLLNHDAAKVRAIAFAEIQDSMNDKALCRLCSAAFKDTRESAFERLLGRVKGAKRSGRTIASRHGKHGRARGRLSRANARRLRACPDEEIILRAIHEHLFDRRSLAVLQQKDRSLAIRAAACERSASMQPRREKGKGKGKPRHERS